MPPTASPQERPRPDGRETVAQLVRLTRPGQSDPEQALAEAHEYAARRLAAMRKDGS